MSFESYRRRVSLNGNDIREHVMNQSKLFVDQTFENSPSYRLVKVNGVDMGVRFIRNREYSVMNEFMIYQVMFRPTDNIRRGDLITFDNSEGITETWMAVFRTDSEVFPYVHARRCNNSLSFETELGVVSHPVIIDNKLQRYQEIEERTLINLPDDSLSVAIAYNSESETVKLRDRFQIKSKTYEVQVVDDITNVIDGVGLINMIIRRVPNPVENEEDEGAGEGGGGEDPGGGELW